MLFNYMDNFQTSRKLHGQFQLITLF